MKSIHIRALQEPDCKGLNLAFQQQGWNKPEAQFREYLTFQQEGHRDVLVAEVEGCIAGYLTIKWKSDYTPFQEQGIPETVDFNILKKFQRQGIGTLLMDEAERRMSNKSPVAGIGVGVTQDYGAAQILYVKRGYIPDGNGVLNKYNSLYYGDKITVDDDVVLFLMKDLSKVSCGYV